MEMKRSKRQTQSPPLDPEDARSDDSKRSPRPLLAPRTLLAVIVVCALALSAMLVSVSRRSAPEVVEKVTDAELGVSTTTVQRDKLLGGLLAAGFDENLCLSRYQSALYRKDSPHQLSPYLQERLRKQEALHKRCAPNTVLYDKAVEQLKSGQNSGTSECNYVVWVSYSGLGNRMLSLASTFLYALLTNKVLLIDRGADMADLFCEPFPDGTWLLPLDFPVNQFGNFSQTSPSSYGNLLKSKVINNDLDSSSADSIPAYVYVHLSHDYDDEDKLFFCEQDQVLLGKVPWLVLRSNQYFVPSLFLIPKFEDELTKLFPQKDTVFHHLGRYLLHPTNKIWGLIVRYYQAYLAKADQRVGIQIRVFEVGPGPFQYVMDQIMSCSLREKLLPDLDREQALAATATGKSRAVLVTSLNGGYFEQMRNLYWEYPAVDGEIISIFQPSNEGYQKTAEHSHNSKAWAEIYLLSLTDKLVISSWSTFGYVAQGLGGLKPWILYKPENGTAPDPPCQRAMSMEPCFHAPPFYDCSAKRGVDTGALVPHVRHCEDMSWGLKVLNQEEW